MEFIHFSRSFSQSRRTGRAGMPNTKKKYIHISSSFSQSRRTGRAGIIEAAFVKASRLDVQRCGRRRRNKIWIQYAFKHHGYRSWRRAFVAVSCWRRVYLLVLLDIFGLDVLKCSRPYGRDLSTLNLNNLVFFRQYVP